MLTTLRKAFLAGMLLMSLSGVAVSQNAPPAASPAAQRPADPLFSTAEKAFLALDVEARRQIQRDLIWVAGFTGTASGDFGPLTLAALKRFETEAKLPVDAILSPPERDRLAKSAEAARQAARFSVETDKISGMRVGIPGILLTKTAPNASGGSRWQDKDEKVTLDLSVFKPDDQLAAMFEKGTGANVPGRKITYKLLRPDFFVITGETEKGKFYRRVESDGKSPPRGFSLGYDKSVAPMVEKYLIAIAAGFEAHPKAGNPRQPAASIVPIASAPVQRRATGLVVAPDTILASEVGLKGCTEIAIQGEKAGERIPARLARRVEASGLLVLTAKAGRTTAIGLAMPADGPATLVHRDSEGELLVSAATIGAGRIQASLQDGGAGALVLDRNGALVALVNAVPQTKFRVAGIVPVLTYPVVPAEAAFRSAGIVAASAPAGEPKSAASIAEAVRPATVSLICASDR